MKILRVMMVIAALVAFSTAFGTTLEAQRGGGGGRGGFKGAKGGGFKGNKGGDFKGKSKGPSEEEIAKLKKDNPDDWEEKLKELQDKYAKKGGKNDVNVELIPAWQQQRLSTWIEASNTARPIVLAFIEKKDELNTKYLVHKETANLSREGAVFVWILEGQVQIEAKENDQAERIKAFGEKEAKDLSDEEKAKHEANLAIIKRSRLAKSNLWEAYEVKKGNTFVICDHFGNEFKRFTTKPSGTSIIAAVKHIEADIKKANDGAGKALAEAKDLKASGKVSEAVAKALAGVGKNMVGIEQVEKLAGFLEEILAAQDTELESAIKEGNESKLKELEKTFAGTRIADAANAALAKPASK